MPNVKQCILEGEYPSYIYILLRCFCISNITKHFHCHEHVPILSLCYLLPTSSIQRANLWNLQHLDLQILCNFWSHLYPKKYLKRWCFIYLKFLIFFHTFHILLVQCKPNNIKTALRSVMFLCYCTTLNREN